jgi:hypothetical protein
MSKLEPILETKLLRVLLVTATIALGATGCRSYLEGRFGAKGQPDSYRGDVPLRVVNIDGDQSRGRIKLCAFALVPAGQEKIPGDDQWSWNGWLDHPVESTQHADFKVKPGRYEVYARMCLPLPNDAHALAVATVDIDITVATEIAVNAGFDPEARIAGTQSYAHRQIVAKPWSVGHGAAEPTQPCIESGGQSADPNRCCSLESQELRRDRWTCS